MDQLTEDEIYENDLDPAEAIASIRRSEGNDDAAETLDRMSDSDGIDVVQDEPTEAEEVIVSAKDDEVEAEENVEEKDVIDDTSENDEEGDKTETAAEAIAKRKFKAVGQEFEFTDAEIIDQFEGVFGKAMDYTQKMQKIAPFRKMISALEEESITQDQFDLALDVLKGDKAAIKKLAEDRDIDLSDLSFDDEVGPYESKGHGKSDFDIRIEEITGSISSDPEYSTTVDVIDVQWDDASRMSVANNPEIITGLHQDIKSGVYAKVAPEAAKLQMIDGNSKSSLDYYMAAGAQYFKSLEAAEGQQKVDELNKSTQDAEAKFSKGSSEAESKRAASPTSSTAGKKGVIDYLDDNDEKFDEWYAKVTSSI